MDFLSRFIDRKRRIRDSRENAVGQQFGFFSVGVTRDDQELFPSPTHQYIGMADGRTDAAGQFNQDFISDIVPVAVIDVFEIVGVDQVKNEVTGVGIVSIRMRAQSLGHIAFNGRRPSRFWCRCDRKAG